MVATGIMSLSAKAQLAASSLVEPDVMKSKGVGKMLPCSHAVIYLAMGSTAFCFAAASGFHISVKVVAMAVSL